MIYFRQDVYSYIHYRIVLDSRFIKQRQNNILKNLKAIHNMSRSFLTFCNSVSCRKEISQQVDKMTQPHLFKLCFRFPIVMFNVKKIH